MILDAVEGYHRTAAEQVHEPQPGWSSSLGEELCLVNWECMLDLKPTRQL